MRPLALLLLVFGAAAQAQGGPSARFADSLRAPGCPPTYDALRELSREMHALALMWHDLGGVMADDGPDREDAWNLAAAAADAHEGLHFLALLARVFHGVEGAEDRQLVAENWFVGRFVTSVHVAPHALAPERWAASPRPVREAAERHRRAAEAGARLLDSCNAPGP